MTNEIVKALEHCVDPDRTCEECALYDPSDEDCECSRKLKRAAVAFIRFQETVIECQEQTIQRLMNTDKTLKAQELAEVRGDLLRIKQCLSVMKREANDSGEEEKIQKALAGVRTAAKALEDIAAQPEVTIQPESTWKAAMMNTFLGGTRDG